MTQEYFNAPGINWNTLKYMKSSPADYLNAIENPITQTPHMRLGSMVDCGLLTPELFKKEYKKAPQVSWKSKKEKIATASEYLRISSGGTAQDAERLASMNKAEFEQWVTELEGVTLVPTQKSQSEVFCWERGQAIIETNKNKPVFLQMMEKKEHVQYAMFAQCPETGLELKGLADIVTENSLIDLKTTARLDKLMYTIRDRHYLGQLAYYDYLLRLNGIEKTKFFFLFIETEAPYKMRVVEVSPEAIKKEHEFNLGLLRKLKTCLDTGEFSDGSEESLVLEYQEVEDPQDGIGEEAWLEAMQQPGQDSL